MLGNGETRNAMDHLRRLNKNQGSVTLHVGNVFDGDQPFEVRYNDLLVMAGIENPYAAVALGNNADGKCFFESLEQSLVTGVSAYMLREEMLNAAQDEAQYTAILNAITSSTADEGPENQFVLTEFGSNMGYKQGLPRESPNGPSGYNDFIIGLLPRSPPSQWPDMRHVVFAAYLFQIEISVICMDNTTAGNYNKCPRIWRFKPPGYASKDPDAVLIKMGGHFEAILFDKTEEDAPAEIPRLGLFPLRAPPSAPPTSRPIFSDGDESDNDVIYVDTTNSGKIKALQANLKQNIATCTESNEANNGVIDYARLMAVSTAGAVAGVVATMAIMLAAIQQQQNNE